MMKKILLILIFFILTTSCSKVQIFGFGEKKDNTQVILPPEPVQQQVQKNDTDLFNSIPVEKEDNTNIQPKQNLVKEDNNFKKPQPQPEQKEPKQESKPQPQQIKQKVEVVKPKPKVVKEKVVKEVVEPKEKKKNSKLYTKVVKKYYIQVAAVTRGEPSKKFLKLITKNGFKYKIISVEIKGKKIKRVMIGPFSKNEARKVLPKVKKEITASAFIKKVK